MTTIEVEVELKCYDCGKSISARADLMQNGKTLIRVYPCSDCQAEIRAEGYEDGRSDEEEKRDEA